MAAPVVSMGRQPTTQGAPPRPTPAAKAAQRYLNRASGQMETAQQIHSYRAPAPKPVPPQGHATSGTTHTVTRTTTSTPRAAVSFINKSPQEVEDVARKLTNAEVSGIRSAYAPQNTLLGQEQQGALGAHATSYGQLGTTLAGLQTQQQGSAKTFSNYAADAIAKAQTAAPGAAQTAEHLGLKPGEQLPESARNQQEAARTLLSGIAQAGAAGTNARQEGEANFLANMQGAAALGNTEGAKNIEGVYARQKGENAAKEGAAIGKAQGNQAKLAQGLQSEQSKLRAAAEATLGKKLDFETKAAATTSKITSERNKEREGAAKLNLAGRKQASDEAYKRAGLAQKEAVDAANIKKSEAATRKLLNETRPGGGKVLTTAQKLALSSEAARIFNAMQRGAEEGHSPAATRRELEEGGSRQSYSKYVNKKGEPVNSKGEPTNTRSTGFVKTAAIKNPLLFSVAEQSIQYGYVNAATKQHLREEGLPDEGWSNNLYNQGGKGGRPAPSPGRGLRGAVNAPGKAKK